MAEYMAGLWAAGVCIWIGLHLGHEWERMRRPPTG